MPRIRVGRVAALGAALVVALGALVPALAQGPYQPTTQTSVNADGKPVTLSASPTVSCQPTITGKVGKTSGTVVVTVEGAAPLTLPVGSDGSFSGKVGSCLSDGSHKVFVDSVQQGTVIVAAATPPKPPATGSGLAATGGLATALYGLAIAVFLTAVGGAVVARRRANQA